MLKCIIILALFLPLVTLTEYFAACSGYSRSFGLNRSSGIRLKLQLMIRPELRLRPKREKSAPVDHCNSARCEPCLP